MTAIANMSEIRKKFVSSLLSVVGCLIKNGILSLSY